jgi:hypothetical protein
MQNSELKHSKKQAIQMQTVCWSLPRDNIHVSLNSICYKHTYNEYSRSSNIIVMQSRTATVTHSHFKTPVFIFRTIADIRTGDVLCIHARKRRYRFSYLLLHPMPYFIPSLHLSDHPALCFYWTSNT